MNLGGGCRGCPPPPTRDDPWLSNTTGIFQKKNFVVYWCKSKTWDRVEEFMINATKMIVKMVVPQLVCKEVNTQEVLLVMISIYSQGMVMFIEGGENPQALILNDSPENIYIYNFFFFFFFIHCKVLRTAMYKRYINSIIIIIIRFKVTSHRWC